MNFFRSTIGKKILIALTGLIMFGFVVGHLLGNLQIFLGPAKINAYSLFLKQSMIILWGTRLALLISVGLHVVLTIQLTRLNRQSRPISYAQHEVVEANLASRTMVWSGLLLGSFIVYHLLHFTIGSIHPQFDPHDVYRNVVSGFSVWYVTLFYAVAMIALGFHLYHGVWSVFQTLGLNHSKYNCWRRIFAVGSAVGIVVGYISIPAAVMLGFLR